MGLSGGLQRVRCGLRVSEYRSNTILAGGRLPPCDIFPVPPLGRPDCLGQKLAATDLGREVIYLLVEGEDEYLS